MDRKEKERKEKKRKKDGEKKKEERKEREERMEGEERKERQWFLKHRKAVNPKISHGTYLQMHPISKGERSAVEESKMQDESVDGFHVEDAQLSINAPMGKAGVGGLTMIWGRREM